MKVVNINPKLEHVLGDIPLIVKGVKTLRGFEYVNVCGLWFDKRYFRVVEE